MNSYGHPQPSGHADEAGYDAYDSYSDYQDTYAVDSYGSDPYPADAYRGRSARATAAVGAASAGRAQVAAPESARPRYDWSGGGRGIAGRAQVPVSPAGGPATGRASVRPGGPAGPAGPAGSGPGEGQPAKKKKRHWIRNSLLIALAVMVISTGGGMVALSYYVDSVPQPEALDLAEASTVFFGDGTEMATLSELNREIIDTTVPELANARNAVVAAEDKGFYDHSGVDFMGIVRAAWGNATGGTRSGASTIDQQYTRAAADLTEDSYTRKLQEAAMAYKLNQEFNKSEILDFYLNTIYLGRGAYGIQAAADAYFNKEAKDLTVGEAALIAGVIRLPDDGTGLSPYDPLNESGNTQVALDRWNYVLDQLVDIDALAPAERAELTELPEVVEPPSPDEPLKGRNGTIVKQVKYELEAMGIEDVATGGYRITTTIDKDIQKAALDAAWRKREASHWTDIEEHVDSALVAVNPADGAVLAYWGGTTNGTGVDMAGPNRNDETGEWSGGYPPGSSAKIYTLIAEMRQGISFDSKWTTSPYQPDWADTTIQNAGRLAESSGCEGVAPDFCTLRWVTQKSFNVSFARFSEAVDNDQGRGMGPQKILEAAADAGVTMIQDDDAVYHDLTTEAPEDLAPNNFDHPIAYGQYAITPLDHANGVATLAAEGLYNKAHFVQSVEQRIDGEWVPVNGDRIAGEQRVTKEHAQAITGVLATIPSDSGFALDDGRPAAAKTGTWEFAGTDDPADNSNAWVVGYTPQIAVSVWVGDSGGGGKDPKPIKDVYGGNIGSTGLPAQIWKQFMQDAHAAKDYEHAQFAQAPPVGNPQHPYANGIEPQQPEQPNCRFPFFGCDDDDGDNGGNQGGGDDQGDDNDGGIILPPPGQDQDDG